MYRVFDIIEDDGVVALAEMQPASINHAAPKDVQIIQFFLLLEEEHARKPCLDPVYPLPFRVRSKTSDELEAFDPYKGIQCAACRGDDWNKMHIRRKKKKDGPWYSIPIEELEEHDRQLSLL